MYCYMHSAVNEMGAYNIQSRGVHVWHTCITSIQSEALRAE